MSGYACSPTHCQGRARHCSRESATSRASLPPAAAVAGTASGTRAGTVHLLLALRLLSYQSTHRHWHPICCSRRATPPAPLAHAQMRTVDAAQRSRQQEGLGCQRGDRKERDSANLHEQLQWRGATRAAAAVDERRRPRAPGWQPRHQQQWCCSHVNAAVPCSAGCHAA